MSESAASSAALPPLRGDIQLYPAGSALDGAPQFRLYDPLSGQYKQIGWAEATILRFWKPGLTLTELHRRVTEGSSLRVSEQELQQFVQQSDLHGLTSVSGRRGGDSFLAEVERKRVGWLRWLFQNYLFIKLPLLEPDAFLRRTLPVARLLVSAPMLLLYLLGTMLGVLLVASKTASYLNTFGYFFSLQGAAIYGAMIVTIKTLHEFAHAYTAAAHRVRVRSMGLVLMVFWPVPYCDVTDGWRIASVWPRLWIGFAGVAAELVLAGLCLLGWSISPPGVLRSICFVASSVTLVSTLLVNLNPAMRFDGYYLLSDLWGIENLRQRASEMLRWAFRRYLLGLDSSPPETVSRRRLIGLVLYASYSWLYRMGLYIGIALLVYYKFTKVLGLTLMVLEIWYFIVAPLWKELCALFRIRNQLTVNRRSLASALVLLSLLLWLALPLPRTTMLPAVVVPQQQQTIYVPVSGTVRALLVQRGDVVRAGQLLCRLDSPQLETALAVARLEIQILEAQQQIAADDAEMKAGLPEIVEALSRGRARRKALEEQQRLSSIRATISGVVLDWSATLRVGQSVERRRVLGRIADPDRRKVIAYVAESKLTQLAPGDTVRFYPAQDSPALEGTISRIRRTRARTIRHAALTSAAQGEIAVKREQDGRLVPRDAYYELEIVLAEGAASTAFGASGHLRVVSAPRSRLADMLRHVWTVILRESSF